MHLTESERATADLAAMGGAPKRGYVKQTFSEIAPSYDLLNHLLSFNIDRYWRTAAIRELNVLRAPAGRYLDLCAGTLDVAAQLARLPAFSGYVLAADFAEPMLRAGAGKAPRDVVGPVAADALELPVSGGSLDGAIVAFGIRNVADLDAGLYEARRVLAPGARFVILEFSTPRVAVVRALYQLYFHHVLPTVGRIVSGHPTAYRYLPRSVQNFPVQEALAARLRAAGFVGVRWTSLTFGIAAIHVGEQPRNAAAIAA